MFSFHQIFFDILLCATFSSLFVGGPGTTNKVLGPLDSNDPPIPGPLDSEDLQEILAFTTALARKAGALMLEGSHAIQHAGGGNIGGKMNAVDLVTEYDVKVEELVRREIAGVYPRFQL